MEFDIYMKRLPFKNGLLIVMVFALLLTSCSFGTRTQNQATPGVSTSTQEETQTVQNTDENAKKSWNRYAHTPSEKLTPISTKIQLDGNTLSYGKLYITLPDGVTVEEQKPENDTRVIDLIGMEKSGDRPFPPCIWLLHYRIAYQNKWELASTLLDILPDITLRYYDKLGDNLHYLFTYDKPYKNGYIMVYEDDVCIVEEIASESAYSFGKLLADDMVHWENTIQQIDVRSDNGAYFDLSKIKVEKDYTLMAMQSAYQYLTQEITLFRDGYFTVPIMKYSFDEQEYHYLELDDYNFDGCQDMFIAGTKIYLWNQDKKVYETAQIPKDFPEWPGQKVLYPETQTIWGYDVEDEDGENSCDMFDHAEMLWKWEGTALVKKRECVAEVREEGARIWAYEDNPEKVLFDETFSVEEWNENSAEVQKRYQQFYAGMVPEEGGGKLHKIDYDKEYQEYIPQAFLDKITKAMLHDAVAETLREFQNDKKLTSDEILTIAKDNLEMRSDVAAAKRYGDYIMVAADVDNDGIMDLIGEEYYENYERFMECAFYKGQEDGTYQKTQSRLLGAEQFDVLSYDGKNYLCQTRNEHKEKKNMRLECYVDGIMTEAVDLTFFPERYDIRLAECAEDKYKPLAEDVLKNAISYKEKIDKGKNIDGASEEKTPAGKYEYQCDLNNDDALEQYNKSVWMQNLVCLDFLGKGAGIEPFYEIAESVKGIAVMMWVEPFAKRNIINILSLKEWEDFEITGFLIEGTEYKKLYRITAEAVAGVRQERYTYPTTE